MDGDKPGVVLTECLGATSPTESCEYSSSGARRLALVGRALLGLAYWAGLTTYCLLVMAVKLTILLSKITWWMASQMWNLTAFLYKLSKKPKAVKNRDSEKEDVKDETKEACDTLMVADNNLEATEQDVNLQDFASSIPLVDINGAEHVKVTEETESEITQSSTPSLDLATQLNIESTESTESEILQCDKNNLTENQIDLINPCVNETENKEDKIIEVDTKGAGQRSSSRSESDLDEACSNELKSNENKETASKDPSILRTRGTISASIDDVFVASSERLSMLPEETEEEAEKVQVSTEKTDVHSSASDEGVIVKAWSADTLLERNHSTELDQTERGLDDSALDLTDGPEDTGEGSQSGSIASLPSRFHSFLRRSHRGGSLRNRAWSEGSSSFPRKTNSSPLGSPSLSRSGWRHRKRTPSSASMLKTSDEFLNHSWKGKASRRLKKFTGKFPNVFSHQNKSDPALHTVGTDGDTTPTSTASARLSNPTTPTGIISPELIVTPASPKPKFNLKKRMSFRRKVIKPKKQPEKKIFGVPLVDIAVNDAVPPVIIKLFDDIEERGMNAEGLYRKEGSKVECRELIDSINEDPTKLDFSVNSVHVLTSVIKRFFREMPNPLLTFELYNDFVQAAETKSKAERLVEVLKVAETLPAAHNHLLQVLVGHLARLAVNESTNRMSSNSLAIVIAPNIFYTDKVMSPAEELQHLQYQIRCLCCLIENEMQCLHDSANTCIKEDNGCHGDQNNTSPQDNQTSTCIPNDDQSQTTEKSLQRTEPFGRMRMNKGRNARHAFILHSEENDNDSFRLFDTFSLKDFGADRTDSCNSSPRGPKRKNNTGSNKDILRVTPSHVRRVMESDSKSLDADSLESKSMDSLDQLDMHKDSKSIDSDSLDSKSMDSIDNESKTDSDFKSLDFGATELSLSESISKELNFNLTGMADMGPISLK